MVRYPIILICATLLAITAAGHAQSSTDHVVLSLKREYGLAVYTQCRLSLVVFERQGRASLWCALNTAGGKSLRAERALTPQEAADFPTLVAAGNLCSGGHIGRDDTALDGILETLQTRCSEGNVAVLVTSGNPTFKANRARRDLLDRLHILEEQLRKTAPLPK
jgi:hypothetical protein